MSAIEEEEEDEEEEGKGRAIMLIKVFRKLETLSFLLREASISMRQRAEAG